MAAENLPRNPDNDESPADRLIRKAAEPISGGDEFLESLKEVPDDDGSPPPPPPRSESGSEGDRYLDWVNRFPP